LSAINCYSEYSSGNYPFWVTGEIDSEATLPKDIRKGDVKMKKTDLAYIAGFFDGEGCIYIGKSGGWHHLRVTASQANEWIITWLKFSFGGSVNKMTCETGYRQRWQWHAEGSNAYEFLTSILPYIKLKKAEAELAIQFQEARRGKGFHVTDKQRAIDEVNRILMSNLKDKSR